MLAGKKSKSKIPADKIFKIAATAAGVYILLIIILVVGHLYSESHLIWEKEGLSFISGSDWNAVKGREAYGSAPYIMGTLVTAGLAMVMGVPVSIGIAMFISQAPKFIANPLAIVIDLLAAVPSIIYGFWGLIVFRDFLLYNIEYPLHDALGEIVEKHRSRVDQAMLKAHVWVLLPDLAHHGAPKATRCQHIRLID